MPEQSSAERTANRQRNRNVKRSSSGSKQRSKSNNGGQRRGGQPHQGQPKQRANRSGSGLLDALLKDPKNEVLLLQPDVFFSQALGHFRELGHGHVFEVRNRDFRAAPFFVFLLTDVEHG